MVWKRRQVFRPRRSAPGTAPGSLSVDPEANPSEITVFAFGADELEERRVESVAEIETLRSRYPMLWINVEGLGDAEKLKALADAFELHSLALEDVIHLSQRPKVEEYESSHFMVVRMPRPDRPTAPTEQMALFVGKNYLLTFQELAKDYLEPVRKRLRGGRVRIRTSGADYLAYAILDAVVDSYFPILEDQEDRLLALEAELLGAKEEVPIRRLYDEKHRALSMIRVLRPTREAIGALLRSESRFIADENRVYIRDCLDHAIQVVDLAEQNQELVSGLIELHRSNVQNRLNEVMKVLTVTATVFIPLSFIAGLYGMNFDPGVSPLNMPELGWYWGYPFALTLMGLVALAMLLYFRRKRWIGGSGSGEEDGE